MALAQQRDPDRNRDSQRDRPSRETTIEESIRTLSPSEFAYEAAWIGLQQMRLGEIAIEKTTDSEIRQFAKKLVADHAGANNRLTQLSRNKGYRLPDTNVFERIGDSEERPKQGSGARKQTEKTRKANADEDRRVARDSGYQGARQEHQNDLADLRRIQSLSGAEFDKAFMNEVIDSHEVAVDNFEHATETVTDEQVKQFAKDALPILEDHLDRAHQLVNTKGWDIGRGLGAVNGAAGGAVSTPANFAYGSVLMSLKEIRVSEIALNKSKDSSVREFAQQMIAAHGGMNNRLLQLSRNKGYEVPSTNLFAGVRGNQRDEGQGEKARQGAGGRKQTENTRSDADYDSDRDNRDGARNRVSRDRVDASDLEQIRQNELSSVRRLQGLSGERFDRAYITEMVRDHTKAVRKFRAAAENIGDEQVKLFAKDALPILQDHLNHAQRLAREKGLNVGRGLSAVEIQ